MSTKPEAVEPRVRYLMPGKEPGTFHSFDSRPIAIGWGVANRVLDEPVRVVEQPKRDEGPPHWTDDLGEAVEPRPLDEGEIHMEQWTPKFGARLLATVREASSLKAQLDECNAEYNAELATLRESEESYRKMWEQVTENRAAIAAELAREKQKQEGILNEALRQYESVLNERDSLRTQLSAEKERAETWKRRYEEQHDDLNDANYNIARAEKRADAAEKVIRVKIKFERTHRHPQEGGIDGWIAKALWDDGDLIAIAGPCTTKKETTLLLRAVLLDRIEGGTQAAMALGELSKPKYRKGMW